MLKESSGIVWWFPNFFVSLHCQTRNTMVRKRTLRERITQLGRICNTEGELMKQRNQHGIMPRTNIKTHKQGINHPRHNFFLPIIILTPLFFLNVKDPLASCLKNSSPSIVSKIFHPNICYPVSAIPSKNPSYK